LNFWQVEAFVTEIFAAAENITKGMLPVIMENIIVLDGQGSYIDCVFRRVRDIAESDY
jgi:hypothetical protein